MVQSHKDNHIIQERIREIKSIHLHKKLLESNVILKVFIYHHINILI